MDHTHLKNIVTELVEQQQCHLVDFKTHQHRQNLMIDVFVDTDSGITTGELTQLNKYLVKDIDRFFGDGQPFSLTVSSPGLDRPLTFPWQFNRHRGRQIEITHGDPDSPVTATGLLLGETDGVISIQIRDEVQTIPHSSLISAIMKISTRQQDLRTEYTE